MVVGVDAARPGLAGVQFLHLNRQESCYK
jgi:hypothetical protein